MARKKSTAAMANKKRRARLGGALLSKLPLPAHPGLVHGFLVKLTPGGTTRPGGAHPVSSESAHVEGTRQRDSGAKREGPAEDATFH
jgi:hypothetical protein